MELWIPDTVELGQVEERINKWLQNDKLAHPYQHLIQQRIHSSWPQLHLHQSLYIARVEKKKLIVEKPVEKDCKPYKIEKCGICLSEDNVVRHTLPCNHSFHVHCILKWFKNGQKSCPLCRLDCKNYYY